MLDIILNTAKSDERIRAVYMNGSRVNLNVEKDIYRDYDIVYIVTETESFLNDKDWVSVFGEPAIIQEPDLVDLSFGIKHDFTKSYGWLMLFKDGNRIDLHITVKENEPKGYLSDTLTIRLLDKDGILPNIPVSSDRGYWIKPPSNEEYHACCNEFWWCLNNVAKGIARKQLPYAMRMYTEIVHVQLEKMTEWYIGMNNGFTLTSGMWGKYFEKYLQPEHYNMYTKTYSGGDYNELWAAIFTACDLFRTFAAAIGERFNYEYVKSEDENIVIYLNKMKNACVSLT